MTDKDPVRARYWLGRASEAGIGYADWCLADMHRLGEGGPVDLTKARRLYESLAARGSAGAQYRLGLAYYHGLSVAADRETAAEWFRKAAAQGDAAAQYPETLPRVD